MRTIAFWISLLLVFSIPCEAAVEYPILGSASRLIGILLALFWIATVAVTGRFRIFTPFHMIVLVFICWNALSVFWSANVDRTAQHLQTWIQLFLMIFILWDLYNTRESIMAGLQMFVLGSYVALGSTIINFLIGNTFYYGRYTAAGTSPDDLGALLALAIPMAWYLADSKTNPKNSPLLKFINYAYVPSALLGIALSATRLALVAALPGIVFGLATLTHIKLSTRIAICLFLIVAGYFLVPFIPQESFQRLGTTGTEISSGDLNGRLELWTQGLAAFQEHPLLGVGSNMYRSVNRENKVAHNSFISVLVELGLVGFVLFGIALAIAVRQIFRLSTWDTRLWLAILAAWAVAASTLTWEYRKPTWLFLSFVIANAALVRHGNEVIKPVRRKTSEAPITS